MISQLVNEQKVFFASGKTKSIAYRKNMLKQLKLEIIKNENNLIDALYADFKKSL